jgi:signal transduction histidine kinase
MLGGYDEGGEVAAVELNIATTVSVSAAATCLSLGVLGAYLGRAPASRHFVYAAAAAMSAAAYCMTDAVVAGRMGAGLTVWAGRLSMLVATIYGASWIAFLAAWDGRALSKVARRLVVASLVAGAVSLLPGTAVLDAVSDRTSVGLGVTYREPAPGPLAGPIILLTYGTQVLAAVTAFRMSRSNPKATVIGIAVGLVCIAGMADGLTAMHVLDLPYLVDPALAFAILSIGSVVVADAAESAKKSAELQRTRTVLAERENLAAVGQLAAVVAHEVRNPVAIIFSALATLERQANGEADKKLLGIVREEADRLKQLVSRLLDAVRPFELQYSRPPAEQLIRAAIAQVTAGSGAEPTEIELVSAPPDDIECDEVLVGQAIANLVQNALVAEGRSSPVRVDARVEGTRPQMLRIEVVDDGNGVPPDARARLFTPFFTTRATGTGLGLALVKRIASAHGGSVQYEPPAGRGASFVFKIPARARDVTPRQLLGDDAPPSSA